MVSAHSLLQVRYGFSKQQVVCCMNGVDCLMGLARRRLVAERFIIACCPESNKCKAQQIGLLAHITLARLSACRLLKWFLKIVAEDPVCSSSCSPGGWVQGIKAG